MTASTSIERIAAGKKPESGTAKFSRYLDRLKPQLALALPKHLNADRMARLALTQFSINPKLQECDAQSIAGALLTAAQLGLEIGVNGQAFLVPYKGKATLVPGWKGLVDLANRSGRCTVWTGAVFAGDDFDYTLGDSPFVKHKPSGDDNPDNLTHVYAIGRVRDSQHPVVDVWPMVKVWKHRDRFNKVGGRHYSYEHPEMYARKIPLLQVLKYMPSSIELSTAVQMAEAADSGEGIVIDGDIFVTETKTDTDGGAPTPPARSFAQFTDDIEGAKNPDEAAVALDLARGLPADQYDELVALFIRKWK